MTITLPLPPKQLSPNFRSRSWKPRHFAAKAYRHAAWALVLEQHAGHKGWRKATGKAVFFWPDRRARDIDNAEASLKSAWDGIVAAGLIVDDASWCLTHQPSEFKVDADNPRVEITIDRQE